MVTIGNKMAKINHIFFKCPKCNCEDVCEVAGELVHGRISELREDGDVAIDKLVTHKYKIQRFECWGCGLVLRNLAGNKITTRKQLVKWLERNCNQKELKDKFDAHMIHINTIARRARIKRR
tara:strand:+ start:7701 stop:8066 length:366 start_codon:yes stop_codon:yes gene_type:complete